MQGSPLLRCAALVALSGVCTANSLPAGRLDHRSFSGHPEWQRRTRKLVAVCARARARDCVWLCVSPCPLSHSLFPHTKLTSLRGEQAAELQLPLYRAAASATMCLSLSPSLRLSVSLCLSVSFFLRFCVSLCLSLSLFACPRVTCISSGAGSTPRTSELTMRVCVTHHRPLSWL